MRPLFRKVLIIGLGLIGGSIALKSRQEGLAERVVGISPSEEDCRLALKRKAVDQAFLKIEDHFLDSDLIILATPVKQILPILQQILPRVSKKTLITDVGSVKREIIQQVAKFRKIHFIGGHPIAGTEESGMKAAQSDLFVGRKWILVPAIQTPVALRNKLSRWVKKLGSEVLWMDAHEHDQIFAATSHLPHVISYSLANTYEGMPPARLLRVMGPSMRDMTRVASSSPEMWRDICLANQKEILRMVHRFEVELGKFKRILESGNEKELFKILERGKKIRGTLETRRKYQ